VATLTLQPANSSNDGRIGKGSSEYESQQVSWAVVHDADSGGAIDVTSNYIHVGWAWVTGDIGYSYGMYRGFVPFDTSGLGSGATVTSAVVTLTAAVYSGGGSSGTWLVGSTQNPPGLEVEDYSHVGAVPFCSTGYTGGASGTVRSFTLNTTGVAAVNKTGWSAYGLREYEDLNDTVQDPGHMAAEDYFASSRNTTTAYRPKLSVEYTEGGVISPFVSFRNV
jgi:hypothetical protein